VKVIKDPQFKLLSVGSPGGNPNTIIYTNEGEAGTSGTI
jgi:hypothetical protein